MNDISRQLALIALKLERRSWRRAVARLVRQARENRAVPALAAQYRRAAEKIRRWRTEALRVKRPIKNPISKRAAAVIRREFERYAGKGYPQKAAWAIAYGYARKKGYVE